jgi:hypothetical protein
MTSMVFTLTTNMSPGLPSGSLSKSSIKTVIHHVMQPTRNPFISDLSTKTTATVVRLEETSISTSMTASSSVKDSTDSVVDHPMEHPSIKVPLKVSPNL